MCLQQKNSFLLLIGLLLFSCSKNKTIKNNFYPIDSLIQKQVYYLSEAKATLKKEAAINDKQETSTYTPADTTAWFHELDVFNELSSINKPINRARYKVEDGLSDPASNLTILSFVSTADLPVVYVKVYYQRTLMNIRKIEALSQEENTLLKGGRKLTMEFQDTYNKPILSSYFIQGGHKMFLGDSVQFSIKGSITIP